MPNKLKNLKKHLNLIFEFLKKPVPELTPQFPGCETEHWINEGWEDFISWSKLSGICRDSETPCRIENKLKLDWPIFLWMTSVLWSTEYLEKLGK